MICRWRYYPGVTTSRGRQLCCSGDGIHHPALAAVAAVAWLARRGKPGLLCVGSEPLALHHDGPGGAGAGAERYAG